MPFEDNTKVLTQFGQLPISVMEFNKTASKNKKVVDTIKKAREFFDF